MSASLDRIRCAIGNLERVAKEKLRVQEDARQRNNSLGYSRMRNLVNRMNDILQKKNEEIARLLLREHIVYIVLPVFFALVWSLLALLGRAF